MIIKRFLPRLMLTVSLIFPLLASSTLISPDKGLVCDNLLDMNWLRRAGWKPHLGRRRGPGKETAD